MTCTAACTAGAYQILTVAMEKACVLLLTSTESEKRKVESIRRNLGRLLLVDNLFHVPGKCTAKIDCLLLGLLLCSILQN